MMSPLYFAIPFIFIAFSVWAGKTSHLYTYRRPSLVGHNHLEYVLTEVVYNYLYESGGIETFILFRSSHYPCSTTRVYLHDYFKISSQT